MKEIIAMRFFERVSKYINSVIKKLSATNTMFVVNCETVILTESARVLTIQKMFLESKHSDHAADRCRSAGQSETG